MVGSFSKINERDAKRKIVISEFVIDRYEIEKEFKYKICGNWLCPQTVFCLNRNLTKDSDSRAVNNDQI